MVLITTVVAGLTAQESPVLLTIGDEKVSLQDFERIYKKNNNETSLNRQTPEEYLELFINFKLKVMEAKELGMDTTAKFVDELEGYRKQLAKPYMTDEESKEEMMKEAYERARYDVNASHILIKLPSNAPPEDTLAALEKITAIRERILNGEDFSTVARATSDDASVARNGGNLGYFTVFSMIYSFETMAYNTPVGEISMPFRSSYGYHILKVNDKRPARGQVKVAHIYIRTNEGMNEEDKKAAYETARMVYDSLQSGAEFGTMARRYSEDPSSARTGGEIPWFGIGRMFKEFEDACFSIDEKGTYTQPIKSDIGWHIIKLIDKKGIGTYEEMKPQLQEKISRGRRGQEISDRYIAKLKLENGVEEHPEELAPVYAAADSTLVMAFWKSGDLKDLKTTLVKIGNKQVTTGEFAAYMEDKQKGGKSKDPHGYVDLLYKDFINDLVLRDEESRLPEKYPEYRYIYEEYHDGILLFDIMDQRVWSKAVSDTLGLEAFHRDHEKDYIWGERTEAFVVSCDSGADLNGIRKVYKKILKGKLDQEDLNRSYCAVDTVPCITLTRVLVEKGENDMVDAMNGKPGLGPVNEQDGTRSFVILKKIRPPEPKKLDEARGQITSDYQNYLEKEWIKELREKYPVEVDRSLLSRIKS